MSFRWGPYKPSFGIVPSTVLSFDYNVVLLCYVFFVCVCVFFFNLQFRCMTCVPYMLGTPVYTPTKYMMSIHCTPDCFVIPSWHPDYSTLP